TRRIFGPCASISRTACATFARERPSASPMSAPDRNRPSARVLRTAKLELRTVARGNGRTADDTSRVVSARGSTERLRAPVQALEQEVLAQAERHGEPRCERLRPAAGD